MRKTRKWLIISAVLALCITACASLFAGCINTPDDTAITYTVTVLTNEETPLSGVSVQLRKGSNRVGDPVTTGADGKAEFEAAPDTYNASITPPTPYSVPAGTNVTLTKDKPNLTVKLQKDSYYTVKLVKPDGTAFYDANVTVGVCTDENCLQAVELSTSGVATMKAAPGNYHVKVYDLPENYAIDVDENGYYTGETFTAESTEMTIKLCDVVKIDLTGTAMTAAEKTAYATSNEAYTETAQALDAYKGTKHLAGGEVVFFSVTAEFSGNYSLFLDETLSYSAGWSGGYFFNGSSCTLEGGMTYKFRFENVGEDAVDTEFVVAIPDASYVEKSGTNVDTINLRINKQGAIAIISFIPEEGGTYTLSVKDGVQAYAEASNTTIDSLTETPDYKANATAEYSVTARTAKSGTIIYFAVVVNAENYPASFNVEIKKTANSEDTYDYAEVKATLTKQTAPEGKELYGVAMDGTAVLVKGSDGYYHLGTADGTIVYVNITGALESNRFYDAIALAYPELSNVPLDLTHNKAEAGAPEQIVDYTKFLRGFSANEYVYNMMRQPTIPDEDDITTEVYYAKYVDENGMYPLNQELYDFLHLLCEVNQELLLESWAAELPAGTTAENAWLFPLYYYGEPTPADPIVGEYKFYSLTEGDNTYYVGDAYDGQNMTVFFGLIDGKLTADVDVLRIAKNLSFTILAYMTDLEAFDESMPIDTGMCVNNGDGTYTLTTDNADMMGTSLTYNAEDGTFSYFDGSATIVFKAANA